MSQIETIVRGCGTMETILQNRWKSTGRGLHQKVTNTPYEIPPSMVKKLRWIATVRNRVVHENLVLGDQQFHDIVQGIQEATAFLETAEVGRKRTGKFSIVLFFVIIGVLFFLATKIFH